MELSVQHKFESYPVNIKPLLKVRETILLIAEELLLTDLQETLKWGEPSYLTKRGSTIRFDWKEKSPEQLCVYFNCKTSLVDTFKEIYGDRLQFEGNRAIVFNINEPMPWPVLKHCLALSMRYHEVKHLPLLGA
jgi:hypothetical protein